MRGVVDKFQLLSNPNMVEFFDSNRTFFFYPNRMQDSAGNCLRFFVKAGNETGGEIPYSN